MDQPRPPQFPASPDPGQPAGVPATPDRLLGLTPEEIDRLPALPGVYLYRDARDTVLYVGKAVNLANRVKQYFTKSGDPRVNVRLLMHHVVRVETIITANEKEAFLLENTLIKRYQPRYNIRLRDDKTYVSVRFNMKHEFPRAQIVRRRAQSDGSIEPAGDGSLFLGPYSSAGAVRDTLRQLQRIFPIRSCPDHVLRNRARPCLLHQIGRCCAPCTKPVDREAYKLMVKGTLLFLKGKTGEVVDLLRERMERHAAALEFEQAAALRDRIRAIEATTERQAVHEHDGNDRDAIVLELGGGFGAFVVFLYRNGLLVSSRPFLVRDYGQGATALMEEFIARYYENETPPREVLVEPFPESAAILEDWLSERREGRVEVLSPQRGDKARLIEVARENARQLLEQHLTGQKNVTDMLAEIAGKLDLPAPPDVIECFDISTIQGFATVGSMVTFRNGEPDKTRYRRFRIKSIVGQDDFASLHEMLTRRFRRVADLTEPAPALAVIDGGKGQLAVALNVFEQLGIHHVPVVGMAKARVKKRGAETIVTEERFFLPGRKNPVVFKNNAPALYLLVRLRDEAHRFGITYHRELRKRRNLRSTLETISGVGKTRASALLRRFGSLKKLKEISLEELAATPGLPADLARRIYDALRLDPTISEEPLPPELVDEVSEEEAEYSAAAPPEAALDEAPPDDGGIDDDTPDEDQPWASGG